MLGMRQTLAAAALGATSRPRTVLSAQLLLIAGLAVTVGLSGGLSPAGWAVGLTCGVITNAALAFGRSHYRADRLTVADWVTLARATVAFGVAALVADSFGQPVPVTTLVPLAALALALDAVDGSVARRTRTTAKLGAQFDGEVDAFLILVLSVYVARSAGAWVLAIGTARYAFLAAGWPLRWMRTPLPPRFWRKVVAATQGIVLTVAAAGVLPPALTTTTLVVALVLLSESFGRDVLWLWRNRVATNPQVAVPDLTPSASPEEPEPGRSTRRRVRTVVAVVLTILAALLVWVVLVAPDQPQYLTLSGFLRLPLEALVLISLALVLPAKGRRIMAVSIGLALTVVVALKVINYEIFKTFDRPFDPIGDTSQLGNGLETLRSLVGRTETRLIEVGAVLGLVVLVVLLTLAMLRLTRVAAANRRWSVRVVAGLGAVWALCWVFGAQLVSHTPIASTLSAGLIVDQVHALQADIHDRGVFAKQINNDPYRNTPTNQLLTDLRGKDVLLVFVEAYGQQAVQGTSFSPEVDAALAQGDKRLKGAGFSARSGFLTSATYGGISWLAHSSLQSGLWVDSQLRYNQLMSANRFTLAEAFKRAGWRTVDDVPSNDRAWPQGANVLPLRQDLQPLPGRLSRPHVHLRVDARPVHLLGAPAPRARQEPPQAAVRGGRHRVEPHAVEPHPPSDRLEAGRQRVDLQQDSDDPRDGRVLEQPRTRKGGLRHVDRVLLEHPDVVRAALWRQEPRADRAGRPPAVADRQRSQLQSRRPDLDHRPRSEGAQADRKLGLGSGPAAQAQRAGLADERLPQPLPQRL